MSKSNKAVDATEKAVEEAFANTTHEFAIGITNGEGVVSQGYTGLAMHCLAHFQPVEAAYDNKFFFEDVVDASTGAFFDRARALRELIEGAFTSAGHKRPKAAWNRLKSTTKDCREAIAKEEAKADGETAEPAKPKRRVIPNPEYTIDRLIPVYNKAVTHAGEVAKIDAIRPKILEMLNDLGVSSSDQRLKS